MARNTRIYAHPKNIAKLRAAANEAADQPFDGFGLSGLCAGIDVVASEFLPLTRPQKTGRVIFPEDPYVDYGAEDEGWALALGFAFEETEEVDAFYEIEAPPSALDFPVRPISLYEHSFMFGWR